MNRIVFVSENKRKIEQITAILSSKDDMNLQLEQLFNKLAEAGKNDRCCYRGRSRAQNAGE